MRLMDIQFDETIASFQSATFQPTPALWYMGYAQTGIPNQLWCPVLNEMS